MIDVEQTRSQNAHDGRRERKAECDGGKNEVLTRAPENVQAARQQRVDQEKSGDARRRKVRRNLSGERQKVQHHAEHEQQNKSPQKLRDREEQDRDQVGQRFEHRAAHAKHQEAAADAQDRRDHHGRHGELDGGRQRRRNQRSGIAAKLDGAAEVAVQSVCEPDHVLLRQRADRGPFRVAWPRFPQAWRLAATTSPQGPRAAPAARRTTAPTPPAVLERP